MPWKRADEITQHRVRLLITSSGATKTILRWILPRLLAPLGTVRVEHIRRLHDGGA